MMRPRAGALLVIVLALCALPRGVPAQQGAAYAVPLLPGWNNVAYLGPTVSTAQLAAALGASLRSLWEFDAVTQSWRGYDPATPQISDLHEVRFQHALWIAMEERGALTMGAGATPGAALLHPGANNIAYAGPELPLAEALAAAAGRTGPVWRWDAEAQRWQGAIVGRPEISEFAALTPGRAYSVTLTPGLVVTLRAQPGASTAPVRGCHAFQARQPQLAELRAAFNRAAFGRLVQDPAFALPRLETDPNGDGGLVPGSVPPALLKAIAWVESSWRQAGYETPRGTVGRTITSRSCAFGVMQVLTEMEIAGAPTAKQERIGAEYQYNIAAGARILAEKWNVAPSRLPAVRPRSPQALEDWYYALWAYHCYGERCTTLGLHDNPDDPALPWPRPAYNSPQQLAGGGRYSRADYPYQELVYGLVVHPPLVDGVPLWSPLPVTLPPPGTVGFPDPRPFDARGLTTDPTGPDDP